jgi:DNA-binding IclR family transcriptional regulator
VLLATQPPQSWPSLVARYGPPERDWPEASASALAAELEFIRAQGWAQRVCRRSGVHSLARALLDPFGRGLMALGVYVPQTRCRAARRNEILGRLAAAVADLGVAMAWPERSHGSE